MEYLGAWGTLIHEKNRSQKSRVRLPLSLQTCPNCPGANPTGTVLPADRRRRIYELCSKYNLLILEGKIVFHILIFISQLILYSRGMTLTGLSNR
jgi:hypothetical protein